MLTALLSATALGVFLEGCGGGDASASAPPTTPAVLGSESNPFLATVAADKFMGKGGADWVSYEESDVGVRLDLSLTTGTAQADFATNNLGFGVAQGGDAVGDTLTDIKNLVGSFHNDWLTGDGEDNNLQGGGGNDRLEGGDGDDTLIGGDGDDILNGGDGNDTIYGGAGVDNLNGSAGADTLQGGAGDDYLDGGADNDILEGGAGVDTLQGFTGDDSLDGGAGNDYLYGDDGEDSYIFESGHGADKIVSDEDGGNLLFRAATRFEDFIFERTFGRVKIMVGEDSVEIQLGTSYGNGRYTLYQGSGDEILGGLIVLGYTGSAEEDVIIGTAQANTIKGEGGNDILYGNAGADTYIFSVGDGTDAIIEQVESAGTSIISLRFEGSQYEAVDFTAASALFAKDGTNLVITIDKDTSDEITDKVTIFSAFDTSDNLLYTINVEYGVEGSFKQVAAADAYWNSLGG